VGKTSSFDITFSAVLLAGGESRRMGRDKATLVFRGQPLWQRQIEVLRDLKPTKIFVSARTEPPWPPGDVELLLDDPPSRGPLSGLTKALEQMRTSHLIVLAVDMPFMTTTPLRALRRLAANSCGVVPVIGDRAEPLAAIYPRESAPDFAAALAGPDASLQALVRKLAAVGKIRMFPVRETDEHLYRSVNTPSEFNA
jgi:molybdenum cofactor guanylyltransferase